MNEQNEELTIDLGEILVILRKRLWIILLAGLLAGVLTLVGTKLLITPVYESTTEIYVLNKQDDATVTAADLQSGVYLTKDYMELVKSRTVAKQVISDMGLTLSETELAEKIAVSTPVDTRILEITVSDTDPKLAQSIADKVRDVAAEHITNVMDIKAVNVVDKANLSDQPASPNLKKNGLIGAATGMILAVLIVLLIYILDDTIKTPDDVEQYLGLGVLSVIPMYEKADGKGKKRKSKGSKDRKGRTGKKHVRGRN